MIWTLFIQFDSLFSTFFSLALSVAALPEQKYHYFDLILRLHWIQNKTFQFWTTFSHRGSKMIIWYSDEIEFWHVIRTHSGTILLAIQWCSSFMCVRIRKLIKKLSSPWKLAQSAIQTFMLLISCCGSFIERKLVWLLCYDEKLTEWVNREIFTIAG